MACVSVAPAPPSPHTPARTVRRIRTHMHPYMRPAGLPHRRSLSLTLGVNVNLPPCALEPGAISSCRSAPPKYSLSTSPFSPDKHYPSASSASSTSTSFFATSAPSTATSFSSSWLSAGPVTSASPASLRLPAVSTSQPISTVPPDSASDPPLPSGTDAALGPYLSQLPSFSFLTKNLVLGDLAFAEDAKLLKQEGVTHVVSVLGGRVHIPPHIPPANRLYIPLADTPFAELVGALRPVITWVRAALEAGGVILPTEDVSVPQPQGEEKENSTVAEDESVPETAPVKILIHCAHGISRSPAVGAALLVALPLVEVETEALSSPSTPASGSASPTSERSSTAPFSGERTTLSASAALAYVAARRPATDVNWGFRAQLVEWEGICRAAA